MLAALCSGCAALRPGGDDEAKAAAAPAEVLRLEVVAPSPLDDLLRQHLDLARVNRLAAGRPVGAQEVQRLVDAAPQQAKALLDTEGHYNAQVRAESLGGDPPRVRVTVTPGPRTVVGSVDLSVTGALAADAAAGQPHARRSRQAFLDAWTLAPGDPFRDADWGRAKDQSMARLRAQGYVAADWRSTRAAVDAATQRAALQAEADSGPLHRTGPLRIVGLNHHDERTVQNIADFPPGTPATETLLLDYQERLQRSGLFDRATVTLATEGADPAAVPVEVRLAERRLQEATFGAGYSANIGPRVSVDYIHRRPFGQAWLARSRVELAQREQGWTGELSTHTLPGLWRNLVSGNVLRQRSDDDRVDSARLRAGRAQETRRISRLVFVETERSLTTNRLGEQRSDALSAHYHVIFRDLDDLLLPTRGQVLSLQGGGGQARSQPGGSGPFARAYARWTGYRPLGSWYGQARVEAGQIFSADDVVPPESMRWRAGGDDSVRGYGYRELAPVVNGSLTSGKVIVTASAEIARPLLARLPDLWWAAFVDAGRAAQRWGDLKPAVGAGVGLRYRSPIGPAKLDIAYGEEDQRFRLHLTVGVTF
ncbi:autotransporter assembly complex protein TamA [Aquabacterium sp. J223]|uniref:autotransporter assembly complex protein TamA n=1 Tax=Aquabacterium sp. J223 TaxID=2898431 RepID=UPI0021AD6E00|nr:BamA/TamA family outer membrane protein [Aquabacterium sp. J223]UUX94053.1 BamA/TamA family outer membrane protein [Aquabacterium sp. J223]